MPLTQGTSSAWYTHWPIIMAIITFIFSLGGFTVKVKNMNKKIDQLKTEEIDPLKKDVEKVKDDAQQMALIVVKDAQVYKDGVAIFQTVANCSVLHDDFKTELGEANSILKEIQGSLVQRDREFSKELQSISKHMGAVNQFMEFHQTKNKGG